MLGSSVKIANAGSLPLAGGTLTGPLVAAAGTAAAPSLTFSGDTDTGFYSVGANQLGIALGGNAVANFAQSATQNNTLTFYGVDGCFMRLSVTGGGHPVYDLWHANTGNAANLLNDELGALSARGRAATIDTTGATAGLKFMVTENWTDAAWGTRIEVFGTKTGTITPVAFADFTGLGDFASYNKILIGPFASAAAAVALGGSVGGQFEINAITTTYPGMSINDWSASAAGYAPLLNFNRSKGATLGTHTAVDDGYCLGQIRFCGSDGTDWQQAAYLVVSATGTIGDNRVPGLVQLVVNSDIAASVALVVFEVKADGWLFKTSNAAQTAAVTRLTISGAAATAVATWADVLNKFSTSIDSAAEADLVSIGGYEISAGHRALAIGSEEAVVAETDETKFSHKLPVRINGATYNLMLCAT